MGDCDDVLSSLSETLKNRSRAGVRHLMSNQTVADLVNDHRLLTVARRALGAGAQPFRATLFDKSRLANWLVAWHQDTALPLLARFNAPGWGPWSEKGGIAYAHAPAWALSRIVALRIHLDASTADNGPLRIVPGSHSGGVLTDGEVLDRARSRPHVECLVRRGGVLAMRPLVIHSSSKAKTENPRRVLHVEYAATLDLGPGIRLAVA